MSWYDAIPGAHTVVHAVEHPLDTAHSLVRGSTDALGITNPNPADISQSPDVQAQRQFRDQLLAQYGVQQPKTAQQISASPVLAKQLEQGASDQSRAVANQNLTGLQGVANGTESTAADALLRQGTDQAAKNATGLAAAYSAQNPGMALRQGLAASNQAYAQAASTAGIQKANEQAQARGQIGTLADAMRGQDLSAATQNQNTWTDTQKTNAANDLNAQQANQTAGLNQQSINNNYQLGLAQATQNSLGAPVGAVQQNQQNQTAANAANQQSTGAFLTALGGIAKSDLAAKDDVKPASFADALGSTVHGVTFKYKPGHEDGAEHAGVIAQDLEKVFPGVVSRGADGMRRVDTRHLSLATTGIVAELAKRLKAVEQRKAA